MSRILVFDLENKPAGEIHANVTRGWAISGGDKSTFTLTNDEAALPFLQIGRMVYVDGGVNEADGSKKLPNWAGMIDTPWVATSPVSVTAYDPPYLMSIRSAYGPDLRTGDTGTIALRFLELANQLGDLYLRAGDIEFGDSVKEYPVVSSKTDWAQLAQLALDYGMEIQFRPEIDNENRLLIYVDLKRTLGAATQIILKDGDGGNMQIQEAALDGVIMNAVKGHNSASTEAGRKYSDIEKNQESIDLYRTRNAIVQFNTTGDSDLQELTKNYVAANGKPYLNLKIAVRDAPLVFSHLRLGNIVSVNAANIILPGGIKGWTGQARIEAMTYDEGINQVTMTMKGSL